MLSILGVWSLLGPSVHRGDKFMPIVLQKTFTEMVPRVVGVGANILSVGGNLRLLQSTGSTSGLYTESTRSISGFDTAGTACCTRGSVLLIILPVLNSIWALSTARTLSTQCLGRQYSNTLSTREYETYSILQVWSLGVSSIYWEHWRLFCYKYVSCEFDQFNG